MFDLQPITTANLLTLVQIVVILIGFIFSWRSLEAARGSLDATRENVRLATKSLDTASNSLKVASDNLRIATANAQAQLYNQMVVQGRDLQYKFMELYHGGNQPGDLAANQDHYNGLVIAYYSACFELASVLSLPNSVQKLLSNDLKEILRNAPIKQKWQQIRGTFSKEFIAHVNSLEGV